MRSAITISFVLGVLGVLGVLTGALPGCGGSDAAPTLKVQARSSGRTIQVAVKLQDAGGSTVRNLKLPDGRRTGAPEVVYLDGDGEELDRQRLSYG